MKLQRIQRLSQIISTVLYNGYFPGLWMGVIYQGVLKYIPCPGLNCYSCPAALLSCPIGALQLTIAYGKFHIPLYIAGFVSFIGAIVGRMVCGWACPFGLLQDIAYKIRSPKISVPHRIQQMRYIILIFGVILFALIKQEPWFCKMLCPAGTLEAGFPIIALNAYLHEQIGVLFIIKVGFLVLFCIWMVVSKRPFCRVFCPLGTLYSFFNRISLITLTFDASKCSRCGLCFKTCPMELSVQNGGTLSTQCIRCLRCMRCPEGAVRIVWRSTVPCTTQRRLHSPSGEAIQRCVTVKN